MDDRRRRNFLRIAGAVGAASVAGCTGMTGGGGSETEASDSGSGSGSESQSDATETFESHSSTNGIQDEPYLGDSPSETQAVIVSFEGPGCPFCARFDDNTFPQIKSELIDTGKVTYYSRLMPVVADWGNPAAQSLEAVYSRDADAYWDLKDFYFSNQGSISTDNVLDETQSYLSQNTDLDAEAVVEEARNHGYDEEIQDDMEAGRNSGIRATPTFTLFKSGEYVTKVQGAKGYSVFENALQL
ncbi:MAG: DsbA family protein [Halobacteria archaeon]|nr:DsbA family protein [Halobacteria archaeon]